MKRKPKTRFYLKEREMQRNIEHMDESQADRSFEVKDLICYDDFRQREKIPVTEHKIERLSKEMVEWAANDPSATRITKFFSLKGIPYIDVFKWCERWPKFKKDFESAKLCIADRLFDGALTKVYADKLVTLALPMLDFEWREESKRIANIKEEAKLEDLRRPLQVIMEQFSKEDDGRSKK